LDDEFEGQEVFSHLEPSDFDYISQHLLSEDVEEWNQPSPFEKTVQPQQGFHMGHRRIQSEGFVQLTRRQPDLDE